MAASQSNVANETSVFDTISESLKQNYSAALDPVLVKQVSDAFAVFESQESSSVDVREVGTIIRSLGETFITQGTTLISIVIGSATARRFLS